MRITTWNVNSLNVRLPHLLEYLSEFKPDIVALQETKTPDEKFPVAEIEAAGYQAVYSGQKTYNGVATLCREAVTDVITDMPEFDDPQRRLLSATIKGVRVINVYIPNGQEVGSDKYAYKFRWLNSFKSYLQYELAQYNKLIVLGDYNITPNDFDVHDASRWQGKITCSEPERAMFAELLKLGLEDSVRQLHPDDPMFSWWDYRMNAFRRRWGIRIDHLLTSPSITAIAAGVATEYRSKERPSDHAPVWLDFD